MTIVTTAGDPPYPAELSSAEDSLFRSADPLDEIERFARLGRFYLATAMRRYDRMIQLMKEGRDSIGPN